MSEVRFRPIGTIHTPFPEPTGTPIQPSRGRGVRGTVEVFSDYVDGLADLDGFSHLVLLYHLHRVAGYELRVVPYLDTVARGLFATRAPRRPNPIGLSVVRLVSIDGGLMVIEDVDILDGTPLLDIKPFVREFDERVAVREGWLEAVRRRTTEADDRFHR